MAVGIAKQEELLFMRDRPDGIALPRDSPALLPDSADPQRGAPVRGDVPSPRAARCAISDRLWTTCPGIGPRRRKQLLVTFGSVAGVRRASREELTSVVGASAADAVITYFSSQT